MDQEYGNTRPSKNIRYLLRKKKEITLDNKFQKLFVSVMNTLLIYLFASMKLEQGYKKITWL